MYGLQRPHAAHPVLDLGDDLGLTVELLDPEVHPELIDEGEGGDGLAEGDAPALKPRHRLSGLGQCPATLQYEARLADAGLARPWPLESGRAAYPARAPGR
jgi:hypothetical protein